MTFQKGRKKKNWKKKVNFYVQNMYMYIVVDGLNIFIYGFNLSTI